MKASILFRPIKILMKLFIGFFIFLITSESSAQEDLSLEESWQEDLANFIRRDRNHASVILWSLGNETLEQLELVHSAAYIKMVLKTAEHPFTSLAPDTPASRKSYLAAWLAAGGCISGLNALMSGSCDVCLSLVRPPGHHALRDRAGGFCIFNNLAIAARHAVKQYGLNRILIIDWDIHHGNGLNDVFYHEKEVLYFSTHDQLLYPYTGDWEQTGEGKGKGYTLNIPIPRNLQEADLLFIYRAVLEPLISRYAPQLILVAAGFDAHHLDPIGRSNMSEKIFGQLTRLLIELRSNADHPPLFFALEGGYHPRALVLSLKQVMQGLLTEAPRERVAKTGSRQAEKLIQKARQIHAEYGLWVD